MKKPLYLFLAISIIFAACKKEEEDNATTPASIIGSWDFTEYNNTYIEGYWTAYPNGQKVTTYAVSTGTFPGDTASGLQSVNYNFTSDGNLTTTVSWLVGGSDANVGVWTKNGNTLTIDTNNVYTISKLSNSNLTIISSGEDTSTHYWDAMNDTVYFYEGTETIKFERTTILSTNTNAKQIEAEGKSPFQSFIDRRKR